MNKKSILILALSLIIFSGCASKNTGTTIGACHLGVPYKNYIFLVCCSTTSNCLYA